MPAKKMPKNEKELFRSRIFHGQQAYEVVDQDLYNEIYSDLKSATMMEVPAQQIVHAEGEVKAFQHLVVKQELCLSAWLILRMVHLAKCAFFLFEVETGKRKLMLINLETDPDLYRKGSGSILHCLYDPSSGKCSVTDIVRLYGKELAGEPFFERFMNSLALWKRVGKTYHLWLRSRVLTFQMGNWTQDKQKPTEGRREFYLLEDASFRDCDLYYKTDSQ